MKKETAHAVVLAGLFTALGILIPVIFHTFGIAGNIFLPMHIPVLLCGFLCGYRLGGLCGLLVPILSAILTPMPPLYPVAVYMACELAAYAIIAALLFGLFKRIFHNMTVSVICALIGSLIGGRIVLAIAQMLLLGMDKITLSGFFASAFVTALPGIIIQLIAVPAIVILISKFGKSGRKHGNY